VPTRTSEIDDRLARRFPRTLNFFSPHKAFTLLLANLFTSLLASLFPLLLSLTWLTLLPSPRKFGRIRCLLHQAHSEFVGRGAGGEGIPNEPLHIRLGQLDDR
jgi:hypothetical protein